MPYNAEDGTVAYVTASVAVRHGMPAADGGFCGTAVREKTPAADDVRANRDLIAAAEPYLLLISGVIEINDPTGLTRGELLYIADADNSISTSAGSGKLVLGKVCTLAGERGCATGRVRVNLNQKVA